MTLLELLVKELPKRGGWPDGYGVIYTNSKLDVIGHGYDDVTESTKSIVININADEAGIVIKQSYEEAIAAQQPAWNGEGLPPVGSKVESFINGEWKLVKVVYTGEPGGEYEALVFDVKTTKPAWSDLFRPIRTEADRKREDVQCAIGQIMINNRGIGAELFIAGEIYSAIAAGKIPGVELSK